MTTDDIGSTGSGYEPDDVTDTITTDNVGSESTYELKGVTTTMAPEDYGSESSYKPEDVTATMATEGYGSDSSYKPEDVTATVATEDGSGLDYEPEDDNTTAQPTEDDYIIDYDNSTSGDGSDEKEDVVGLIDDEDYADAMGGAAGGAVYKKRRKRETSERSYHKKNPSKEKHIDAVENFEVMKESINFQKQVHRILKEEDAFREKMDNAMELYKSNALIRDKTYIVSSKTKQKLPDNIHRSIFAQTSEDVRDVFGNPIRFEYHDSFDPYEQVPKSK